MIHPIVKFGDPVLEKPSEPITSFDEDLKKLVEDMFESMYAAHGVGLAAPQIRISKRVAVVDVTFKDDPRAKLVLINPEMELSDETEMGTEGCLSFPEITGEIERAKSVMARGQTLEGDKIEIEATGLLARALQHEADHLNGILFIDRMSSAAKASLSSRLKRLQKETRRSGGKDRPSLVGETTL